MSCVVWQVPGGVVRAGAGLRRARVGRAPAPRAARHLRRAPRRHHRHRLALARRLPLHQQGTQPHNVSRTRHAFRMHR